MYLLHIKGDAESDEPLDISLCSKAGSNVPQYMILSHRWREDEVIYSDLTHPDLSIARSKLGYSKLETSCRLALQMGYQYAWLDTCCIDKSSSAELSEAINSMYRYYAESSICFAYLDDVGDCLDEGELEASSWFTRGWTLQEMIAPNEIHFFSKNWTWIGTKHSLCERLSTASGVKSSVLRNRASIKYESISEKMSWAARRETTREEDESYSLLGIFGVNLPPLYGEGSEHAFRRLQIEIMNNTLDHTIFAWHRRTNSGDMLATSTRDFLAVRSYRSMFYGHYLDIFPPSGEPKFDYAMSNFGLHIELPLTAVPDNQGLFFAFLACEIPGKDGKDTWTAIILQKQSYRDLWTRYRRVCRNECSTFQISSLEGSKMPPPKRQSVWIMKGALSQHRSQEIRTRFLMSVRFKGQQQAQYNCPRNFNRLSDTDSLCFACTVAGTVSTFVLHEYKKDAAENTTLPISTVAIGEVNGTLWVFIGFGVSDGNGDQLCAESFEFPAGYAWRRYRNLFLFCFEDLCSLRYSLMQSSGYFEASDAEKSMWNVRLLPETKLDICVWGEQRWFVSRNV